MQLATYIRRYDDGDIRISLCQFSGGTFSATSMGINAHSLEELIEHTAACFDRDDAKTEEERRQEMAEEAAAQRRYAYGMDYACGVRD